MKFTKLIQNKPIMILTFFVGLSLGGANFYQRQNLSNLGYYRNSFSEIYQSRIKNLCSADISDIQERMENLRDNGYFDESTSEQLRNQLAEGVLSDYTADKTNFFFTVHDMNDNVLLSSYTDDYQYSAVEIYQNLKTETVETDLTEEEYQTFQLPENANILEEYEYMDNVSFEDDNSSGEDFSSQQIDEEYNAPMEEVQQIDEEYNAPMEEVLNEENLMMHHITYEIPVSDDGSYYVTGYVRSEFYASDKYSNLYSTVQKNYKNRYIYVGFAILGGLLTLFSGLVLLARAGYRDEFSTVKTGFTEKIPTDVFSVLILCALAVHIPLIDDFVYMPRTLQFMVGVDGIGALILWYAHSVIVRIRAKELFSNTFCFRALRGIYHLTRRTAKAVPSMWKTLVPIGIFDLLNLFGVYCIAENAEFGLFILILLYFLAHAMIFGILYNLHILEKGGQNMADGILDKIPEKWLFGRFLKHARNLNSISEGMNKAVTDKLKSEMFRTELIANVSHDIKTPLTSIINYTDLLSKMNFEDKQASEYIDVLGRQSARLRKLTEDVLEASKATTGTATVHKEKIDFRVLIEQIEGEFIEKFNINHLTLVSSVPEHPLYIMADGRQLWRVLDNLFNNVCKYAMSGTRVYLNVTESENEITFMLRNISATELNLSAEELMERFVRGDRSRNTEGSGLGLSIAQSLTALQGGVMELQIDGDLFKAIIRLPQMNAEPLSQPEQQPTVSIAKGCPA